MYLPRTIYLPERYMPRNRLDRRNLWPAHAPLLFPSLLLALFLFGEVSPAQQPVPRDWTTWGYDQEHTGWNRGESSLSKNNVSGLKLLWNTQLSTPPKGIVLSTLTAPLVAGGRKHGTRSQKSGLPSRRR